MEKLEKMFLENIIENLKNQMKEFYYFEETFEETENFIEKLIIKIGRLLLQELIKDKTKEIGFENKITTKINNKVRIFNGNKKISKLSIITLFGNVTMEYKTYYNKTTKSSKKVNCINFIEDDKISPNVKKKIIKLTPFDFYEDANDKLYDLTNINIGLSALKRVTNSIGKENNFWLTEKINQKNKQSYKENIVNKSDRIILSNDGGRFKKINFEKKGRNAKRNPEWKEAKAGVVFEINDEGEKINKSYYYGGFEKNWYELEAHLNYAANRFGIIYCRQFETISDSGNGIKQMYERKFNLPDNKKYFDATDFYHTLEYLWELGKKIFPNKENIENASKECEKWIHECTNILLESGGEKLLEFFKLESYDNKILKDNYTKYTSYFKNHFERMNYHILKKNKLPIGSGEMEASIKKIINKRFKRNNIYWLTENANNLFNLACTILNGEFDEFWNNRKKVSSWYNIKKSQKIA